MSTGRDLGDPILYRSRKYSTTTRNRAPAAGSAGRVLNVFLDTSSSSPVPGTVRCMVEQFNHIGSY